MDVRSVGVMPRFLTRCVEEGWDVFGTDNSADAEAVTDVKVLKPTVVVVGNGAYLLTLFVVIIDAGPCIMCGVSRGAAAASPHPPGPAAPVQAQI